MNPLIENKTGFKVSGSQPRAIRPPPPRPQEDIWQYLEMFLVVTAWRGGGGGEGGMVLLVSSLYPTLCSTAPQQRNIRSKLSIVLTEKPWHWLVEGQGCPLLLKVSLCSLTKKRGWFLLLVRPSWGPGMQRPALFSLCPAWTCAGVSV